MTRFNKLFCQIKMFQNLEIRNTVKILLKAFEYKKQTIMPMLRCVRCEDDLDLGLIMLRCVRCEDDLDLGLNGNAVNCPFCVKVRQHKGTITGTLHLQSVQFSTVPFELLNNQE